MLAWYPTEEVANRSRKRVRQLKKRKKSCFWDFEKKVKKNVKNVQIGLLNV